MSEELTDDFILDLLGENKTPYQSEYLEFPDGGPVSVNGIRSSPCKSKGCGSPTFYYLRGIPYCSAHLIALLSLEIMNGVPYDMTAYNESNKKVLNL